MASIVGKNVITFVKDKNTRSKVKIYIVADGIRRHGDSVDVIDDLKEIYNLKLYVLDVTCERGVIRLTPSMVDPDIVNMSRQMPIIVNIDSNEEDITLLPICKEEAPTVVYYEFKKPRKSFAVKSSVEDVLVLINSDYYIE